MKTYWDLTEKDRAALTEADVENYANAELMTLGVLRVAPLELLTEPTLPPEDVEVFMIRTDGYTKLDVAFRTAKEAQDAIGVALHMATVYLGNSSYPVAQPLTKAEVIAVAVHSRGLADTFRRDFEKVGEIRRENSRRKQVHDEEVKKETDALKGLWADWHACLEKAARVERVVNTFSAYLSMADGDEKIARKFLAKAYPEHTLQDASEWHGRRLTWEPDGKDRELPEETPAEAAVSR